MFWWFVFAMGHLVGISPKDYKIPPFANKKSDFFTLTLFYIAIYKSIWVYLFYIYIILHGYIKSYRYIYFYTWIYNSDSQ